MSKVNAVKVIKHDPDGDMFGSGLFFKACCNSQSFVLTSKHSICQYTDDCESFTESNLNECRTCIKEQDLAGLELKQDDRVLTPNDLFISKNQDIAVVSVFEISQVELDIRNIEQDVEYSFYGFKKDSTRAGRILVGQPVEYDLYAHFNITSNAVTELVEKSESFYGLSGSVIFRGEGKSIIEVYAVVTDNEENNDVGCELLAGNFLDDVNSHFKCEVFSVKSKCQLSPNSFSDIKKLFNSIHVEKLSDSCNVEALIPKDLGYPFFNFKSIVEELSESFVEVLGTNSTNEAKRAISAVNVLLQKREYEPAKKLLTSRIMESYLSAPHVFSSTIDCDRYYNLHLRANAGTAEYIYSDFHGSGDLKSNILYAVENMFGSINDFSYSLLESNSLIRLSSNKDYELFFEMIFSEDTCKVKSIAILCTFPLTELDQSLTSSRDLVTEKIIEIIKELKEDLINRTKYGVNLYLFVLPVNSRQEIANLLEAEVAKI
ncbi:hypothetical protein Shal_1416 [Shewanella halifaxensis HAW-EB4]|uniref:Anti-bacteriophage protein A/HamA C-terminal domain-containing protein n=1 Tax=Shewanella halifaxensis (strain HAW-EB4) TaxID=458817 RepID=B0TLN2_SHEHH|nr:hypothetical protein [Shewanella halifaxensis]ABZ75982.1 hypothetical protein Shal_1416 [Shewanella halifaxensis HAW-EB4]